MDLLGPQPAFDLATRRGLPHHEQRLTGRPRSWAAMAMSMTATGRKAAFRFGKASTQILSVDATVGEASPHKLSTRPAPQCRREERRALFARLWAETLSSRRTVNLGSVDSTKDTAVIGNDVVVGKRGSKQWKKVIMPLRATISQVPERARREPPGCTIMPFLSRYRLVDFPCPALVNAGLRTIRHGHALQLPLVVDHVGSGRTGTSTERRPVCHLATQQHGTSRTGARFLLRDLVPG